MRVSGTVCMGPLGVVAGVACCSISFSLRTLKAAQ